MNLYEADNSEIVRSRLRDDEHLEQVKGDLTSLVQTFFGHRGIAVTARWISTLSNAIYYAATTVSGVQTVGEEYLGLVQVDGSDPRFVATDFSRLLASLFESFHEIAVSTIFKKLSVHGQLLRSQNHLHPTLYKISQELPNLSHAFVDFVKAFTVALFYLFKTPYHDVSKAITDIRYRSIRPQANFQTDKLYKFIGLASLFRLAFVVKQKIDHYTNTDEDDFEDAGKPEEETNDTSGRNTFDCQLCCDSTHPVSTPCGHVFCWNCIERSKVADGGAVQCPSCRFQFAHGRSIPLMNL